MGNKIRIKQIDLQGIFSASSQVDILSASNYASFVTQLDTTMSSDAELSAVSSSISQSIYTINQVIGSGLVSGSSQLTASYDTRYILSGSITQTTWDNIENKPNDIVSSSQQISDLGFVTGSYTTINEFNNLTQSFNVISGSVVNITNAVDVVQLNNTTASLNLFTSSYFIDSSSFDSRIGTEKGRIDAILSASNANTDTFAEIVSLINSVDLDNDNAFATFYTSSNSRISSLENSTGSYETKGSGILSGSVSYLDLTNIPSGIVSQSIDLSSLNSFTQSIDSRVDSLENATGSYLTSLNGALSSSSQLTGSFDERYTLSGSSVNINTGSFATTGSNTFSGSQVITGSLIVSSIAVVNGGINVPTGSTLSLTSGSNIFVDSSGGITGSFSGSVFGIGDVTAFSSSLNNRILSGSSSVPVGTVSGSSQLTASYDTRYALSSSLSSISSSFNGRFNGLVTTGSNTFSGSQVFSGSMTVTSGQIIASTITNNSSSLYLQSGSNLYVQNNGIVEITGSIVLNGTTYTSLTGSGTIPSGTVSGSSQLTSSYDLRYTLSGSVQPLPSGVISGSSQLTSSFDTRYALSGSGGGTIPAGTISGSSQLTSSFDGRYVQTGSFNTLTASFNSFTASAQSVTTGSNSFNGTQTITGSLIITTGSFVGSQILANTSSLYLTSGSNMYVQNNGVVEITGSLNVRGTTRFETVGGDEGGEIEFGVPQTNTSLSTRVVQDIFQNRLRIFDGNTNGVFIDLSKAPIGVAGEITWKSSGIVNAGTFVQLDNIKATVPSSGNRALALATVSGTISGYISGHYQGISSSSSGITQTVSLSTSTSTSMFGWNFAAQGDTSHYILRDDTNNRVYRFILMIGNLYNNNFISIERLH